MLQIPAARLAHWRLEQHRGEERDNEPVKHALQPPGPAARDAPHIIERFLDATQQGNGRDDQKNQTDRTQCAVAGLLNQVMNRLCDFILGIDGQVGFGC